MTATDRTGAGFKVVRGGGRLCVITAVRGRYLLLVWRGA
ncbi:hypothetical protein FTUN_3289 [Frigoriglobus tundricola]|uniref:Uncharacterized protein n=1 Tax=Frigoriglobus tundricola TaxID=2774151 RepID=A0A6M5YP20_9BACT|nr:hypothetical protein FTUN_3289 [Frigoriglobus tundricola]